ncbi:MAG: hypothetical protein M1840_006409 [Geoglossum simile]|nr:MAG: hypothetical protein M1840_006409 [Geoglossum simile]
MDPLSVTASIIATLQLTSKVIEYLNDVKDAPKDRAHCAIEASNLYNLLTALRYRLEEGTSNEPWNTAVRALGVKNGPLDQYKLMLEQLQTKIKREAGMNRVGYCLLWKFIKEEVMEVLARIERLKTLVQIALEMDHFKLSQAIGKGVNAIQQHQNRHRHDEILEWISLTDFPAQQSDFIARRQEGTGLWFLDSTEFTEWVNRSKKTLFCPGIPGAGKTMIVAITINYLLQTVQSNNIGVAYLYCNYKAQADQNTTNLLAAILKQLVQARPSMTEPVARLYDYHASRRTRPSLEEIFSALQSILTNHLSVYLLIDALDECSDKEGTRSELLNKLYALQSKTDLHLMVTSRFIPEIANEFKPALTLEVRASKADVKRFVEGQMYRLPNCVQRDEALQVIVQEKLVEAVDGMFLIARLHFDSLLDKITKKKVQSALDKLSKGSAALGQAYDEAIKRIEGQLPGKSALAKSVLSWIAYAERPLTTEELCNALAVELGEEELDPDNIPDVEDLVSVCAGLVTVDRESNIIRLVHYTAQEYVGRIREEWNPRAQLDIASACLTYLSFSIFRCGSCPTDKDFESRLKQNVFLDYAARHWGHHTLTVQDEVCELACSFLQRGSSVSCAVQAMSTSTYKYGQYTQSYPKETTGLHLTAQFGLLCLTKELLSMLGGNIAISTDSRDSYGRSPLWLAAAYGHGVVVKLLLEKGADVNAQDGFYGNTLRMASYRGHEQIVKLLLDKGADINMQGRDYGNALQAASDQGHEQIVKLLLDKGADVNAQGGYALQTASDQGHKQIVKLLLDKCDDVNAQGGNALQVASYQGHKQIVKLLFDKCDDVNAQGGNALQAASDQGHEQVVKLLLDKGADVNAQGGNALQVASYQGHKQIVKLLLDKGADVNAQGGYYGNALQAASVNGHEQIVKLLLDKGADVNAQGGIYGNTLRTAFYQYHEQIVKLDKGADALQAALVNGHEQVVKLLLDKDVDVNAQGGYYGNALQAASDQGHEQIVRLLLDRGADINAQGGIYGNTLRAASYQYHEQIVKLDKDADALQAASVNGHEQVVKLLLDKDVDVNAQGGYYGNALQAASDQGHEQIVRLLLDKGADVNMQGGNYGNALQAASDQGHEQIVRLLLDKGADVNMQGGNYGNALQAASVNGHEQIVKLLLDKGVDVNAQGGHYGNALQAASIRGREQIVKLLLDKGANANAKGLSKTQQ